MTITEHAVGAETGEKRTRTRRRPVTKGQASAGNLWTKDSADSATSADFRTPRATKASQPQAEDEQTSQIAEERQTKDEDNRQSEDEADHQREDEGHQPGAPAEEAPRTLRQRRVLEGVHEQGPRHQK